MFNRPYIIRGCLWMALLQSGVLPAAASEGDLAAFRQFSSDQFQDIQPAFDTLAARFKDAPQWPAFEARLRVIDEVTAALLGSFNAAKTASLESILSDVVAVAPAASPQAAAPANPRTILERYEDAFRQPLPSIAGATDDEMFSLRDYYNRYATVASRFIADRGQLFAGLSRGRTADIVELCLVVPFLHVPDDQWSLDHARQIPPWLQTPLYLPVCENFALVIGRHQTAWTFHRLFKLAHQSGEAAGIASSEGVTTFGDGKPSGATPGGETSGGGRLVDYLIEMGKYRHQSKDYATAYRCLKQAIARLDPDNDLTRLNDLRFTVAELVSVTGHSQIAADEMKRVLESSPDPLHRGRSAVLRLKYLFEAQKFDVIITEAPALLANPEMAPYEPQLLYIAWIANRRENQSEEADKLKTKFIASYPDHALAADVYFADAMTALAASNYDEAKRLLEILQYRFPQSRLVRKAKEIIERLATVEAEKK